GHSFTLESCWDIFNEIIISRIILKITNFCRNSPMKQHSSVQYTQTLNLYDWYFRRKLPLIRKSDLRSYMNTSFDIIMKKAASANVRGEAFGVMGESGCGQTTLCDVIACAKQLSYGRVPVDGVSEIKEYKKYKNVAGCTEYTIIS
uniref:ABC transporter domain-containing protein n=1 Tax=Glossina austeni TaxID=7395 RepID=A0A1A9UCY3_GLOAU